MNHSIIFSWKVGNDDHELSPALCSSYYNILGKNVDGYKPGITLDSDGLTTGNGVLLYIVVSDAD